MAGHRLIDDHLARLARDLPPSVVEELADGLTETWQHHRDAGLAPEPAARAAIAEFGTAEQIVGAFVTHSPGRRLARLLLATGPAAGLCWGAALATGHAWTRPVPPVVAALFATTLVAVAASLAVSATARRSYRRTTWGAYGGLALIGLDVTMVAGVLTAAPAPGGLVAAAVAVSVIRVLLTARALPRSLAATSR